MHYGLFCPIAKASEIIVERWTPLVIAELLEGSTRFNDIRRGVPLMSQTLLSQRLKELEWREKARQATQEARASGEPDITFEDFMTELRAVHEHA